MIDADAWNAYLRWRPEFIKIVDETLYPMVWVDHQVASGAFIILHNEKACALYEFKAYPSGAIQAEGVMVAGNLGTVIAEFIPAFEAHAKRVGAIATQIDSREGWGRALRERGYQVFQTSVRKTLE